MPLRLTLILAFTASTAFALSEENVNQQFDAAAGGRLVVDVDCGSIDLGAGPEGKVSVEAYRKIDSDDEAKEKEYFAASPIVVTKEGETVTVRVRRTKDRDRWSWSGHVNMDSRYTIRVPKNYHADLRTSGGSVAANGIAGEIKVDTSGGNLKFAQLRGPLDARTSGGSISLEACEGPLRVATSGGEIVSNGGSGNLEAKTSGGSVAVRNFSGDTDVKTSGGKLTLENIKGRIVGKTSAGSITAALVDPVPSDVTLQTSAGSIDVAVPPKAPLSVEAKTSMGRIRTEIPMLTHGYEEDDRLIGTLNGGGKSLVLKASVGSITIRPIAAATANR